MGITNILYDEERLLTQHRGPRQEGSLLAPLPRTLQLALWQVSLAPPSKYILNQLASYCPLRPRHLLCSSLPGHAVVSR